eukprot:CAMPEP_0202451676 /NCGR_PEP_ID=MMETSP1360-20130828/10061_1 /ASSEMBLY_ACC=CAM_ASM_000848 /TAXON_ID=515479 /ORGANISM="Licmophora paradoxa, Strain CCMP2313" /LENGTH=53 /DNA_ID=CAMNT_0049070307 /DNA_START=118 /DNA_END=276 /DNA_ORIENTATION=-
MALCCFYISFSLFNETGQAGFVILERWDLDQRPTRLYFSAYNNHENNNNNNNN